MATSNNNAYAIFDLLPDDDGVNTGKTMESICLDVQMSSAGVYRILKAMEANNIARSSLGESTRRVKAFWWRNVDATQSSMAAVFGKRLIEGAPKESGFGRYASVWDYGQGREF